MLPDTSDIDAAIMTRLSSDAALMGITSDGVWWDISPQGKRRFVIVSRASHEDVYAMTGAEDPAPPLWERPTYLVKAVIVDTSALDAIAAAKRIHQLLQTEGGLVITGYALMLCHRVERVRYAEIDEQSNQRWNHHGGHYEVWAASA
jgi:hypothetical protein